MKSIPPDSCLKDYKKRRSAFLEELIASTPNVSARAKVSSIRPSPSAAAAEGLAHGGRARPHVGQGRRDAHDFAAGARRALGDHRGRGPRGVSRRPLALGDREGVNWLDRQVVRGDDRRPQAARRNSPYRMPGASVTGLDPIIVLKQHLNLYLLGNCQARSTLQPPRSNEEREDWMNGRKPKRAITLTGRGPAAGLHIGVLGFLKNAGIEFDVWSLSGIGA